MKKVLFIGSFKDSTKDGGVGGQMYACKTIIDSRLSESINWVLVDSTSDFISNESLLNRILKATKRFSECLFHILFSNINYVLAFSGAGASFIEKGAIILVSHFLGKKTIIAPRAGLLKDQFEESKWFKRYITYVFLKADNIICQSNFWKNSFQQLLPSNYNDKFVVINNAININLYPKVGVSSEKKGKVNILFLGWVIKDKGIFELIDAAKIVVAKEKGVKFVIAGKGEHFKQAQDKVIAYELTDYFDFRGWVLKEEKKQLIQETDIFVLPTYTEGLSNSLIEAMASGLPCITTNVTSMPDIITNENLGILVENKNVIQLSDAILDLVKNRNKRVAIGENARLHITTNFTTEKVVEAFTNIFI